MRVATLPRLPRFPRLSESALERDLLIPKHAPEEQRDSIINPAERPRDSKEWPEWIGYDPEIQRLLR